MNFRFVDLFRSIKSFKANFPVFALLYFYIHIIKQGSEVTVAFAVCIFFTLLLKHSMLTITLL